MPSPYNTPAAILLQDSRFSTPNHSYWWAEIGVVRLNDKQLLQSIFRVHASGNHSKQPLTAQTVWLERTEFRSEAASLLERIGSSASVDDEKLTLISQALLQCIQDLDTEMGATRPPPDLSERVRSHARPRQTVGPNPRATSGAFRPFTRRLARFTSHPKRLRPAVLRTLLGAWRTDRNDGSLFSEETPRER